MIPEASRRESDPTPRSGRVVDLGVAAYDVAYRQQLELVGARQRGEVEDTLVLVEHPHVITVGRAQKAKANVVAAGDVEVVEVERGGDVTYHGPGQLVAYPILQLEEGEKDLHRLLRHLEEAMMRALADVGVAGATRRPGATGVWMGGGGAEGALPERKIASIGIACRKWVTFHGLALNVATDLARFAMINPCGFAASVMTSASREAGRAVSVAEVKPHLVARLSQTLGRDFR
jgi:lipoate-protein ligase B